MQHLKGCSGATFTVIDKSEAMPPICTADWLTESQVFHSKSIILNLHEPSQGEISGKKNE